MVKKEHDRPSGMVARAVASDALSCSICKCIIVISSLTSLDACVHRRWCFEFDEPISLIGTYPLFPGIPGVERPLRCVSRPMCAATNARHCHASRARVYICYSDLRLAFLFLAIWGP